MQKYTVTVFNFLFSGALCVAGRDGEGERERRQYVLLTNSNKKTVFKPKTFQCNIRHTNGQILLDVMI